MSVSSTQASAPTAPAPLLWHEQMLSGAAAGLISRFIIAPWDVVKIRLQLQTHRVGAHTQATRTMPPPPPKYTSVLQSWRVIVREEGATALWKGNASAELLYLTYGATQFLLYGQLRAYLRARTSSSTATTSPAIDMLSGGVAGMGATALTYPLDLLRTRFAAQGEQKVYRSVIHAVHNIYRQEGVHGFYRGLGPSLAQIAPYMALTFGFYEMFRRAWDVAVAERLPEQARGVRDFVCGGTAGILSKVIVLPLDVIRKRLQVQGPTRTLYAVDAVPRYESLSILRVAGSIVRTEGPLGLFKGLVPSVMKAAPSSAVTFFVYAQCQRLFLERREAMAR